MEAVTQLYDSIVDPDLLVRRMYVVANRVVKEGSLKNDLAEEEQLDMFSMIQEKNAPEGKQQEAAEEDPKAERARQEAILAIRKKYGKNAIFRGMDLQDAATLLERNAQVGGHRA